jgi:hypothetical protein
LFYKILPKITLTNFQIILGLLALSLNKSINLGVRFGFPKVNDYIDLVVSTTDIAGLIIAFSIFFRYKTKRQLTSIVALIYLTIPLFFMENLRVVNFYHFSLGYTRLFLWVYILCKIYKDKKILLKKQKISLFVVLIIFGLFDHLLLSSSLPVILVFIIFSILEKKPHFFKNWLLVILGINLVVACLQIILGNSIGLHIFGEPYLSVEASGVAKQNILNNIVLRGYGLTNHPNILAFVGSISLWVGFVIRNKKLLLTWLVISFLLVIISFSRSALLAGVFILLINFYKNSRFRFRFFHPSIFLLIIIFIFLLTTRVANSDIYRYEDFSRFIYTYMQLPLNQKFFGIGLGQYSFLLQSKYHLGLWQYQPVHNIGLQVVAESGLLFPILAVLKVIKRFNS